MFRFPSVWRNESRGIRVHDRSAELLLVSLKIAAKDTERIRARESVSYRRKTERPRERFYDVKNAMSPSNRFVFVSPREQPQFRTHCLNADSMMRSRTTTNGTRLYPQKNRRDACTRAETARARRAASPYTPHDARETRATVTRQ